MPRKSDLLKQLGDLLTVAQLSQLVKTTQAQLENDREQDERRSARKEKSAKNQLASKQAEYVKGREGAFGKEDQYPFIKKSWPRRAEFIQQLKKMQDDKEKFPLHVVKCRRMNYFTGQSEGCDYYTKKGATVEWDSHLLDNIEHHNVIPSMFFIDYVIRSVKGHTVSHRKTSARRSKN